MPENSQTWTVPEGVDLLAFSGPQDSILRAVERATGGRIVMRGSVCMLYGTGFQIQHLKEVLSVLAQRVSNNEEISVEDVQYVACGSNGKNYSASDSVVLTHRGRSIRAKTTGQLRYLEAIQRHDITFCTGPAGSGKTYLAMAYAVDALRRHEVSRIVLTRPVVEAGENLGFLPGSLQEKVDPYVRPLMDALGEMMEPARLASLMERGQIEVAPLAYMRGRTLHDSFVILDEAQNATPQQLKMFLTRLGNQSKFVITGDATQRDLPAHQSALMSAQDILGSVRGITFVQLDHTDVVRHALVARIVRAYDDYEQAEYLKTKG